MMKRNKVILPILITICLLFVGIAILAFVSHSINPIDLNNPNKDRKKNGILYFYDDNKKLLSSYKCKDANNCKMAIANNEDDPQGFRYDKSGTSYEYFSDKIALINDGSSIIDLYVINDNKLISMPSIRKFKTYKNRLPKNIIIMENDELDWGVFDTDNKSMILPFEYQYIGVSGRVKKDYLDTSIFLVKKYDLYYLVNDKNIKISSFFSSLICDYNSSRVVTMNEDGKYVVKNYNGEGKIDDIIKFDFYNEYIICKFDNGDIKIYIGEEDTVVMEYNYGIDDYNVDYEIDNGIFSIIKDSQKLSNYTLDLNK